MNRLSVILLLLLLAPAAWGVTYNIGPGQTYETFAALDAAQNLIGDDIVDGGGNTFNETWTLTTDGTAGHPIILRNFVVDAQSTRVNCIILNGRAWIALQNFTTQNATTACINYGTAANIAITNWTSTTVAAQAITCAAGGNNLSIDTATITATATTAAGGALNINYTGSNFSLSNTVITGGRRCLYCTANGTVTLDNVQLLSAITLHGAEFASMTSGTLSLTDVYAGVQLDGTAGGCPQDGLYINNCDNILFDAVRVRAKNNARRGLHFNNCALSSGSSLSDSEVGINTGNGVYAITTGDLTIDQLVCVANTGAIVWLDTCTDILITDSELSGSASAIVYMTSCADCLVTDSVLGSGDDGVYFTQSARIRLSGCTIENNGGTGVVVSSSQDSVTENCSIANNAEDGYGVWGDTSDNNICRYNRITGNGSESPEVDGTGDAFTCHDASTNNQCYGTLLYGNMNTGVAIIENASGSVCNNTIYNNGIAGANRGGIYIECDGGSGWVVQNNIVTDNAPYELHFNTASYAAATINYNLYYHPDDANFGTVADAGTVLNWATYHTTNGYEANSQYGDPLFVNAAGDIFTLLPGSSCIRKGVDLGDGASYLDFNGFNPDIFGWNIGAYCQVWQFDGPKLKAHMNNATNGVLQ